MQVINFSGVLDDVQSGYNTAQNAYNTGQSAYNTGKDTYQAGQDVVDKLTGKSSSGWFGGATSSVNVRKDQDMSPLQTSVGIAMKPPLRVMTKNLSQIADVTRAVNAQTSGGASYQSAAPPITGTPRHGGIPTWAYVVGGLAAVVGGYMLLKR